MLANDDADMPLSSERLESLRTHFQWQSAAAHKLGSPLYGRLFAEAATLLGNGCAMDRLFGHWQGTPARDLPSLRWAGGLHYLALSGNAPALARHYPSCGGDPDWTAIWSAIETVQDQHFEFLAQFMTSAPQTNEVQRSAMIIPGLHLLSHQFGTADSPKLELLELGASAGLNQFPDRIGVDYETFSLGPAEPRLSLQAKWTGQPIPSAPFSVISRRGCDLNPIDATSPTGTLRLQSYVWPDQMERLIRLRKAIELAQLDPPSIDRSNAAQWLSRELSRPQIADLRVVFHSYVWIYLSANERAEISAMMDDAGARADHRHQLAWLHLEDDETGHRHFMTLTCWPNKRKTVLAHGSPHGQWLHWYDESQRN